jgi:hypothetical protein
MPNKRTPGGCGCCDVCGVCDKKWLTTTFTISGLTSSHKIAGYGSYATCVFDLTVFNGTYVVTHGVNGAYGLCPDQNDCVGKTSSTATKTVSGCTMGCTPGTGTSWDITASGQRKKTDLTDCSNPAAVTELFSIVAFQTGCSGGPNGQMALYAAIADGMCCETMRQTDIAWSAVYSTGGIDYSATYTPFAVEIARTFRSGTPTAVCRNPLTTQTGEFFIAQNGDSFIGQ